MIRYALIALGAITGLTLTGPASAAAFARAPCPVAVAAGEKIDCGVLTVPENRKRPGGRMIGLAVEIFRSRSATPAPDPVIFLPGGPGGSATRQTSGKTNPFLDDRDYILLEPRGARYATTDLECPKINALKGEISAGHLSGADADRALIQAAAACRAGWVTKGVDLDGYTSAQTADDIDDLRHALGIKQWNLFGHSYGTRLALTVLRDHPDGIRSVMLDSVLPPEADFDESAAANLRRALNAVFDNCAVTAACAAAHPQAAQTFEALVRRADASPLILPAPIDGSDGRPVVVTGAVVVDAIYSALHNPDQIGRIPAIVDEASQGRTARLAGLIRDNQGPSGFTWGLRLSIWCGEEMPFEDGARVEAQTAPALGLGGIDERTASVGMCRAWNVARADPREALAVTSDVPVLILSGEYDPDTPPAWARNMMPGLGHARVVLFAGRSHGAGFNRCGGQVELAFLRDPAGALNADCAAALPGSVFER
jgi:pimeloyl-ACP methyl ester carboxylesterase